MSEIQTLPTVVARFVDALNSGDEAGLLATLAEDAFVNDAQREFWGKAEIAPFVGRELITPRITMAPGRIRQHYGLVAVDAEIDGAFDKTALPAPLILSFYFTTKGEEIVTLMVIRNRAAS